MASYFQPQSLTEALALRAKSALTVLAGGTDIFPARATGEAWGHRQTHDILDISQLAELRGITRQNNMWRIGALATWSNIADAELPALFDSLKLAARDVGGRQIQNRGTLAGNICNASPAADGVPCLAAMEAQVEIQGQAGTRCIPILEFISGYRSTVLAQDELVTAILIPERPDATISHFLKLGARRYLVISIAMVAGVIVPGNGDSVEQAFISVGACSEKAVRLTALEDRLKGQPITGDLSRLVEDSQFADLNPIGDIRASGEYRNAAAIKLVSDMLRQISGPLLQQVAS